jgi:two-component system response regulator YesN
VIRMIIADDEPVTRLGLQSLNWEKEGFELVGVAANGLEALAQTRSVKPDLILSDIRMPGIDGLALMELLKTESPSIKFVFITAYHQLDYALTAIKLGAAGFVLKPTDPEEIMMACNNAKQYIEKDRQSSAIELGLRQQVKEYSFTLQGTVMPDNEACKVNEVISKIINYMELNYMREVTISKVAEMLHYHPDYLSRLFKKETGENFSDTLTRIRMQKTLEMLRNPQVKVFEIADRVGIRDSRYFGQMFKKHYGMTPNEFRKQLLVRQAERGEE